MLVRRGRRRGRGGLLRHLEQTVIISPAALQPRRNGLAYRLAANKPLPPGSDLTQKGYFRRSSSRLHLFLSFAFFVSASPSFCTYLHTHARAHIGTKKHTKLPRLTAVVFRRYEIRSVHSRAAREHVYNRHTHLHPEKLSESCLRVFV